MYGIAPMVIHAQTQVSGNISPNKIEIDTAANLNAGDAVTLNAASAGSPIDWQKDTLANTDPASLTGGVAVGIIPGTSGRVGGTGHWYGARLVDGYVNGKDTDIFLQGGKVNEPLSWMVGAGSVGSAKFDETEAYMANNEQNVYFGMERAGNSGTTAFDFEFNQNAPNVPASGIPYIPNRSLGDKLISFELQGSGGATGTVLTYIFNYNGTVYVPLCDDDASTPAGACPAGLFTSINGPNTPAGSWGRVNSQNAWVADAFDRRLFAEAQVPLSLLPGISGCGDSLFVQIRTRSSSSLTSDAKDTSPIFEYLFGGPAAAGGLISSGCGLDIGYDGSSSRNSTGGTTNLTYAWTFKRDDGTIVGTSDLISGTFPAPAPGTYFAELVVTEGGSCIDDVTTNNVTVYNVVGGSATLTPDCDDTFTYSASGTGGSGSYNFSWTIYKENGATDLVAKTFSSGPGTVSGGTLDIDDFNTGAKGAGTYYAVVRISDSNNSTCLFDATSNVINVRYAVGGSATLTADCDDTFGYSATGTGGTGSYNFSWTIYKENGAVDLVATTFSSGPAASSSGQLDIDDFNAGANGEGNYYAVVRITDANNATCFFDATSNSQDVRYPLTASASKTGADVPGTGMADTGFVATLTGSTNALPGDTVTTEWQYFTGGVWTASGDLDLTYPRNLADICSFGSIDSPGIAAIFGDNYKVKRCSLQVRLHAVRTLNGNSCPVDSAPVSVKAGKIIDP